MVTTSLSPLSTECTSWKNSLRSYKDLIQQQKQLLPQLAIQHKIKEDLLQIDHFDNQFYIQLINIHDLKRSIKHHENMIQREGSGHSGIGQEVILADHAHLLDDYQMLHTTLDELIGEFERFAKA
jgi:hypothetical protein